MCSRNQANLRTENYSAIPVSELKYDIIIDNNVQILSRVNLSGQREDKVDKLLLYLLNDLEVNLALLSATANQR